MQFLCGNDTVAVAMHFAMKNGRICFSLRKFLAISPAIQKIASDCGCDAVVHLEGDRKWSGHFSYCKKQAHIFRANFGTNFQNFFGTVLVKFRGPVSWATQAIGEGRNPSAPVRPWGGQSAGNRQGHPPLKPLDQPFSCIYLLRLR